MNVSLLVIMMWLLSNLLIYVLTDTEICKGKELIKDKKSIPEKLGSIFKVFDPTEFAVPTCAATEKTIVSTKNPMHDESDTGRVDTGVTRNPLLDIPSEEDD